MLFLLERSNHVSIQFVHLRRQLLETIQVFSQGNIMKLALMITQHTSPTTSSLLQTLTSRY